MLLAAIVFVLAACASDPDRSLAYTVKRGDTLFSIAQRHHVDLRDLARWNGIGRDNVIHPGQVLRLYAPNSRATVVAKNRNPKAPAKAAPPARPKASPPTPQVLAPPVQWRWPVDGGAVTLTTRPNGGHGLMIRGTAGQEIRSAAGGRVVYSGTGLLGLGQLLIIKHNDSYLSAYGHTATVAVNEGDYVAAGQRIATMGKDGQGIASLYFEIRINGAPGNPLTYLPVRPAS
ncbi:MAG: peptidoglycan DD-metalloendopeptidase family protein [Steroidobacteraceae bacterium]